MAIAAPHYRCLRELHRRGELHQGGSILEIGEANWYGDQPLDVIMLDIAQITGRNEQLEQRLRECGQDSFAVVKVIYELFFDSVNIISVDYNGTPSALPIDLNKPLADSVGGVFQTVINHGTLEHVFDVCQVFRTMHDFCAIGGLMIHESPFTGWIDHGFWTIQPTTYFDLCAANDYEMTFMAVTEIANNYAQLVESREQLLEAAANNRIPNNSMLYVAMRKQTDAEFKIPMQGVYAGTISKQAKQAWATLR